MKADYSASNWGPPSSRFAPAGAAPHQGAALNDDQQSGFQTGPAAFAYSSYRFPAGSSGAPAGSDYPDSQKVASSPGNMFYLTRDLIVQNLNFNSYWEKLVDQTLNSLTPCFQMHSGHLPLQHPLMLREPKKDLVLSPLSPSLILAM